MNGVIARVSAVVGVLTATLLLLAGCASPAPQVNVADFRFTSMDAHYDLARDRNGRSRLETTETLVALFPSTGQDHGIERVLPRRFDGHLIDLNVRSVTNADGLALPYTVDESADGEYATVTVRAEEFLHGSQTFVLNYTQRDVTIETDSSIVDELFWSVNGAGQDQPFDRVTGTFTMSPEIASHLTGAAACYRGTATNRQPCGTVAIERGDPTVLRVAGDNLAPHEGIALAATFTPDTFTARGESSRGTLWITLSFIFSVATVLLLLLVLALRLWRWRNARVPGEASDADLTLMEASDIAGHPIRGVAAAVLGLAITGSVRLMRSGPKRFAIHFRDQVEETEDDTRLLRALFPRGLSEEARRPVQKADSVLMQRLRAIRGDVRERLVRRGLRVRPAPVFRFWLGAAILALAFLSITFGVLALNLERGGSRTVTAFIVAAIAAVVSVVILVRVHPLTEAGAGARAWVQDVRSAEITEAQLPYQVLFGNEKAAALNLGERYLRDGKTPDWYHSDAEFTAAAFAEDVHSLVTIIAHSWSGANPGVVPPPTSRSTPTSRSSKN